MMLEKTKIGQRVSFLFSVANVINLGVGYCYRAHQPVKHNGHSAMNNP